MPARIIPLATGEFYHVYNRGVTHQNIFSSKKDYERLLLCLSYYRFSTPPVKLSRFLQLPKDEREVILERLEKEDNNTVRLSAFCLMPNHFHLLMQQTSEGGISKFMKKITDSYTRYFNTKNERVGPLFQGAFKAVHVTNNEQLLHLSRYIHLNPLVSFVVKDNDFISYPWSSLQNYLETTSKIINTKPILDQFKSSNKYLEFVLDQADYGKKLERIKHLTLE